MLRRRLRRAAAAATMDAVSSATTRWSASTTSPRPRGRYAPISMTRVADAAASIDATLAAVLEHQRRVHRRDLATERLIRRRATLTAETWQ